MTRPGPTSSCFSIRGLSVRYGGLPALHHVHLEIPRRKVTALVGPSGCGKSTLLHCLNRLTDLIESCRVDGEIRLDGESIARLDARSLRRRVGLIFQRPNPFPISVRRNVQLALEEHGVRKRSERDRILESVLREVGLWEEVQDRLDRPATRLSGGQQQRLCIARAIALEPEVLLLDEPCSSLDPIASGVVEDLIERLAKRYTIVIVTHNLAQARRLADEVAVFWMRDGHGQVIEQGPSQQIFENPREPETAAYVSGRRG